MDGETSADGRDWNAVLVTPTPTTFDTSTAYNSDPLVLLLNADRHGLNAGVEPP
jgi:hypothetical protein